MNQWFPLRRTYLTLTSRWNWYVGGDRLTSHKSWYRYPATCYQLPHILSAQPVLAPIDPVTTCKEWTAWRFKVDEQSWWNCNNGRKRTTTTTTTTTTTPTPTTTTTTTTTTPTPTPTPTPTTATATATATTTATTKTTTTTSILRIIVVHPEWQHERYFVYVWS